MCYGTCDFELGNGECGLYDYTGMNWDDFEKKYNMRACFVGGSELSPDDLEYYNSVKDKIQEIKKDAYENKKKNELNFNNVEL